MMLGSKAVTNVIKRINGAQITDKTGNNYIRAYKYEKSENEKGEYIAVNHLPFVNTSNVEEGIVNVNIHVPKTVSNLPDTKRLEELCDIIIELFPNDLYIDGGYFTIYSDSRPTPDNDGTYYVNIKIKVRYINADFNLVETL